ncbi:retrotransposon protein, putative, unclassified [Tanacetum coccineum]
MAPSSSLIAPIWKYDVFVSFRGDIICKTFVDHLLSDFKRKVTGKETRKNALEIWGGKPDVLVACVGGGINDMGLLNEFVDDKEFRLIGSDPLSHISIVDGKRVLDFEMEDNGDDTSSLCWHTYMQGSANDTTQFTDVMPSVGDGPILSKPRVDVVVPVESIRAISERFANKAYGFFLVKHVAYPLVANYVRKTWGKYDLVKSILNSLTEIFSFQFSSMEGLDAIFETGSWFLRNNPLILKYVGISGCGTLLKEDVGNVPVKLHGVLGSKKNNVSTSGNKKKYVEPTKEVSKSNSFNVFNSVKNVVNMGKIGRTSNLRNKKANSCGFSFWNAESSSTSTTHIVEKIDKMERLIIHGTAILVDDEGIPLKRVNSSGDHDSDDEVAAVDNDMANF